MRGRPQKLTVSRNRWNATWFAFLLAPPLIAASWFLSSPAAAEVRVVHSQGHHRMGNHDTREDAVRLATESAKRNALEQVATYLESITVVNGMDVLQDEIRTYTAGLVVILEQQTDTRLDGETAVVTVHLVTRIDTEQVAQAISALRQNEDARVQLADLKHDNERLQEDLEQANQALANASTPKEALQVARQRRDILNHVQSNAVVSQVWMDWALVTPIVAASPWDHWARAHALLTMAHTLYPASPYVPIAQHVMTTRHPPAPPEPPTPPADTLGVRMPSHEVVAAPGSLGVLRTLNEIIHRTPKWSPQTTTDLPKDGQQGPQDNSRLHPPSHQPESLRPTRPTRVPAPKPAPGEHVYGPPSGRRASGKTATATMP